MSGASRKPVEQGLEHVVEGDPRSTDGMVGCLGCELSNGTRPLPGGRVHEEGGWVVEHCVGPLGVGTLIVKPLRHVTRLADLSREEAAHLGTVLHKSSRCVHELRAPDQVYACLWSHAGWAPGHIHFVVQPAWNASRERHSGPGPRTQVEMFEAAVLPSADEVEEFCDLARAWSGWPE